MNGADPEIAGWIVILIVMGIVGFCLAVFVPEDYWFRDDDED